jgi:hypothetical protein
MAGGTTNDGANLGDNIARFLMGTPLPSSAIPIKPATKPQVGRRALNKLIILDKLIRFLKRNSMDYAAYRLERKGARIIELERDDLGKLIIGVEFNNWATFASFINDIIKAYELQLPVMKKMRVGVSGIDHNTVYIHIRPANLK